MCIRDRVTSVTGNTCPRGPNYAHDEVVAPKRMLTSTLQVKGGLLPLLPVVSKTTLPKERILDCAAALRQIAVKAPVTDCLLYTSRKDYSSYPCERV